MKRRNWVQRLLHLLDTPPPEPEQQLIRIRTMERDLMLPVKVITLVALGLYLFSGELEGTPSHFTREEIHWSVALHLLRQFFVVYATLNLLMAGLLFRLHRASLKLVQWVVFTMGLVDALFLSAVSVMTGGFESLLYYIYVGLIIRNAFSLPVAALQIVLNLLVVFCYVLGGVLDTVVRGSGDPLPGSSVEAFALRIGLLVFMTFCCYFIQLMFDQQRGTEEELREFQARQEQLHAAGRLAAEIAHRLKNPLGIINNAAYTLQKGIKEDRGVLSQQVQIIREEVDRTDRIITELMGYAQLVEGKVEKLEVCQELDRALEQVFPIHSKFDVRIHRNYSPALPALLMQRTHLSEIFVNLLQNSREIMHGRGEIFVSAKYGENYTIWVTIEDTGPGIAPENLSRIWEPYFTTKEKGTGLGLAIVKHNMDIYGGTVQVESEPGKGARFVLQFRAKTIMKLIR